VSTSAATNRLHLAEPGLSGCGSEEGEGADREDQGRQNVELEREGGGEEEGGEEEVEEGHTVGGEQWARLRNGRRALRRLKVGGLRMSADLTRSRLISADLG